MGGFADKNSEEIHDIFRHENIQIGLAPQMRYWPASAIYGVKKSPEWTRGEEYILYCLSGILLADVFEQLPQLLLEGVDWTVTAEATPNHMSDLPEMHRLNQAFCRLGNLIPSKNQLTQLNTRHFINVLHNIVMHLITNHSHKSTNFPKTYMSPLLE